MILLTQQFQEVGEGYCYCYQEPQFLPNVLKIILKATTINLVSMNLCHSNTIFMIFRYTSFNHCCPISSFIKIIFFQHIQYMNFANSFQFQLNLNFMSQNNSTSCQSCPVFFFFSQFWEMYIDTFMHTYKPHGILEKNVTLETQISSSRKCL